MAHMGHWNPTTMARFCRTFGKMKGTPEEMRITYDG